VLSQSPILLASTVAIVLVGIFLVSVQGAQDAIKASGLTFLTTFQLEPGHRCSTGAFRRYLRTLGVVVVGALIAGSAGVGTAISSPKILIPNPLAHPREHHRW